LTDKLGETCDHTKTGSDRKQCESAYGCIDNKCACSDTTKEHTFLVREDGVETEVKTCVDKEGKLAVEDVKTSEMLFVDDVFTAAIVGASY